MTLRAATAASLSAVLTLTACGPVEENPGPPGGVVYVAPPLEPRRNSSPSPDVHRWLEASASVRIQLATLREELAGLQQLHVENHFDDFLALDPDTLEPGQLYYLHHFLERLQLTETVRLFVCVASTSVTVVASCRRAS